MREKWNKRKRICMMGSNENENWEGRSKKKMEEEEKKEEVTGDKQLGLIIVRYNSVNGGKKSRGRSKSAMTGSRNNRRAARLRQG